MPADGTNPFRWRCGEGGENCYVENGKPRIGALAKHLPGLCAFTDVDMLAEINGRCLLGEFKEGDGARELKTGQRLALQGLACNPWATVVAICGSGREMTCSSLALIVPYPRAALVWQPYTTEQFHDLIRRWGEWASRQQYPDASMLRALHRSVGRFPIFKT